MTRYYARKRYWCPRGGQIDLSHDGYLSDPNSKFGKYLNVRIKPLDELLPIPCLVLLGEPGTGKSTIVNEQRQILQSQEKTAEMLWLDLGSIGSEQRLVSKLFQSPEFLSWSEGDQHLHIFLDSLDECLLRVDTVGALLTEELRAYPVERLFLRIVCRTADWPLSLENDLVDLFGEENTSVFELAPLTRSDVIEAAKAHGLDSDAFIQDVDRVEAVPLAIKPITLSFLLNSFRHSQGLSSSQTELYAKGCELLCSEPNQRRRDSGMLGIFGTKQKLVIAARIAAITILSNKYAVWTGVDAGDVAEEDIPLESISGGVERYNGTMFEVSEASLRETLVTGLFSSRGRNRLGWAHHTYAEYLASWYLNQSGISDKQVLALLKHVGDTEAKVVPQLSETAAWLASMNSEIFSELLRTDPEVLLRSDIFSTDIQLKGALVESLLRSFEEERLLDRSYEISKHYRKLCHPGLASQLRPYICDRSRGVIARRVAIDIAEECRQDVLTGDLVAIALDQTEEYQIRIQATCAVSRIGDDTAKSSLIPLARGEGGDDPNDELKGYALQGLWPGLISTEELFSALEKQKKENYFGSFAYFLSLDFVKFVPDSDIIWALHWVQRQEARHLLNFSSRERMDAIIFRALDLIPDPLVTRALAQTAISRLQKHDPIAEEHNGVHFHQLISLERKKRLILIETLIDLLEEKDVYILLYQGNLVFKEDIPWLLEKLTASESNALQRKWSEIILRVFNASGGSQLEAVYVASQKNDTLAEFFRPIFAPTVLNSPQANELRNTHAYLENNERSKKKLLQPPPAERIRILLDSLESGDLTAWWRLNREMTLEPDSTHYENGLESDLTVLPGWKTGNPEIHDRILAGAKTYLLGADPETPKWLGTKTVYFSALAGYRALRLVWQFELEFVEDIPPEIWAIWAPIILAYPTASGVEDGDIHTTLVKRAFKESPKEVIYTLLVLIDQENREGNYVFITRKMVECWGYGLLEDTLFTKLKDPNLKIHSFACLLGDLLEHGDEGARYYAESLLGNVNEELAVVAAASLLCNIKEKSWDIVWLKMNQDVEFGKKVVYQMLQLSQRDGLDIIYALDEGELSALYIWLEKHFPRSEDPSFENEDMAHWVGPRESVAEWRDSILRVLKERGTREACCAISEILDELPYLDWVRWILLEAQTIMRRKTWLPLKPDELLAIMKSKQLRFIQSGEQLVDCILESLEGLEAKLQGETPAAIDLWNHVNGKYTPKDENAFSDYVKRYLEEDLKNSGIVVNREVEIRRSQGGNPGERTDIIVDAVVPGRGGAPTDVISVVVEVKGCWHKELLTAIQTQLVGRYLRDNACQFGLYLVGWFNCKQWDENDYRSKEAEKHDRSDLVSHLTKRAQELSKQDMLVRAKVIKASLR